MTETIPIRVQHKRMSASDWLSSSLVLLDGELGVESDTGKVKVGNGRDQFSALQYLTGPKGDRGERGEIGPRGADGVMRFEALTSQQKESLRGPQGLTGPIGPRGPEGQQGPQGQTGPKGDRGDVGPKGADGKQGPQGIQGATGLVGPRGATGAIGPRGPEGQQGPSGAPGQNIINQNDGQPLKYWFGSKAQYNAIANKDSNTIYDVYE